MERNPIPVGELSLNSFHAWSDQWFLLTAGHFAPGEFNMMTVAWGSLGVMWKKPFAQVVVRPSRHTLTFLELHDSFTLSAFGPGRRDALQVCGSKSGRDIDKVQESGLTPIPSEQVDAPAFNEAQLILECRKIYHDDFKPSHFLSDEIEPCYGGGDYHRVYFGEVLAVHGIDRYRAAPPA